MTGALLQGSFLYRLISILDFVFYIASMIKERQSLPFIFAVLWLLLVTFLLCIPGTEFPKITWTDRIFLDKWIHAALFTGLVLTWCWFYSRKKGSVSNNKRLFFKIALCGFLYGIGTEIVQELFVPFRAFEIPDIIADGVGVAAGYFVALKKILPR